MPSYRFAESAEGDLADIVDFTLRTWGATQASRYIDGLEALAATLAMTPEIGKPCENLAPELRAFPYQSHVLYYLVDQAGIVVVRVIHESMNAALQFDETPGKG